MKKFIKGTFELGENVIDADEFIRQNTSILQSVDWANEHDIWVDFGVTGDNDFLCEYKIVGNTLKYCKGMLSELKSMLKQDFPKMKSLWEGSGDQLW